MYIFEFYIMASQSIFKSIYVFETYFIAANDTRVKVNSGRSMFLFKIIKDSKK